MANFNKLITFNLFIIFLNKQILCNNKCFEYSCEVCNSPDYGHCTKCKYGWKLIDGTCPCFNSSCALCITGFSDSFGSDVCKLCKKGYFWYNYYCHCSISNCQQCGEKECLLCKIGYIYNNNSRKCERIKDEDKIQCNDPNCDICFSELKGACVKCKVGFKERKGECIKLDAYYPVCDGVDCSIEDFNLRYFCPSNRCLVCDNHKLNILPACDNSVECSSNDGCLNCISSNECLVCNQGYYLLGGLCYKCIEGCSICYNDYSCEYCFGGFELTSDKHCILSYKFDFDVDEYNKNKEILLNQTCSDSNCLSCFSRNYGDTCQKCINGYGAYRDKCRKCQSHCLDCYYINNVQYCDKCEEGYKINDIGKCSLNCSDKNCLFCHFFSFYNPFVFPSEREYCYECKKGYKINGNKCSLCSNWEGCEDCFFELGKEYCIECIAGYYLKEGNCIKCSDENCYKCSLVNGTEQCIDCIFGYGNKEGICTKCSEKCERCYFINEEEGCLSCGKGYGRNKENDCIKCKEKCTSCDFQKRSVCYSCENGYLLKEINGHYKCDLICSDTNCLECSLNESEEICNECKIGYRKEKYKCLECEDEYCLKCDDDEKICTECVDNKILINGKCYENQYSYKCSLFHQDNHDYCLSCSSKGKCIQCIKEYILDDYGICKKKKKKNLMYLLFI